MSNIEIIAPTAEDAAAIEAARVETWIDDMHARQLAEAQARVAELTWLIEDPDWPVMSEEFMRQRPSKLFIADIRRRQKEKWRAELYKLCERFDIPQNVLQETVAAPVPEQDFIARLSTLLNGWSASLRATIKGLISK
jgi:hypothetical protein